MIRRVAGLTVLLVTSVVVTVAADPAIAERWSAARLALEGAERWTPGSILMTLEFLGRDGETEDVLRMVVETTLTPDGPVTETTVLERPGGVIGALMSAGGLDPEDRPADETPDDTSANGDRPGGGAVPANPFDDAVQPTVELTPLHTSMIINGVPSDAVAISWEGLDGAAYEGTVWLAAGTSRPALLDVVGQSANRNVRRLSAVVEFSPDGAPALPHRVVTSMVYRLAVVITMRIRMTMILSDYFPVEDGTDGTVR